MLCLSPIYLIGQETDEAEKTFKTKIKEKTSVRGYIKDLHQLYIFEKPSQWKLNNIIHQRTAFRAYLNDSWTFGAEARSQIIYGSYPRLINDVLDENRTLIDFLNGVGTFGQIPTSFGEFFMGNAGPLDTHFLLVDQPELTAWTDIDRLWLDWSKGKFEVRVGKQRVNWGVNFVWNPNDIFNTFNFTDFDYEERAASDAVRLQYFYNTVNKLELVLSAGSGFDNNTVGLLWKVNQWNYDFQFFGANFQGDWVGGLGWSGSLKNIGFKGESTYFISDESEDQGLVMSVGLDYAFTNGLALQAEVLYNEFGTDEAATGIGFSQTLSARTLSQYEWSIFLGAQGGLSPRSTLGAGIIFQPSDQTFYFAPSYTYSLAENVDLLIIGQFIGEQSIEFLPTVDSGLGNFYGLLNTRLKWSF